MYIADYEYVQHISSFAVSDIKLWLEEDRDVHTDHIHPLYSSEFIQSEAQN